MTKLTVLLSAVAAAFCAQVSANGVCYDPDHVGVMSKNAQTVVADMAAIRQRGFNYVRTYISKFGNVPMGQIIAESGMKVALGVPFPYHDAAGQAEAAISAAQNPNVEFIFVGNENLAHAHTVPADQIALINSIKSRVPARVKVGTVQRNTEFLDRANMGGFVELVNACDVLGVNIHPFFNPNTKAEDGVEVLDNHWHRILNSGLPGIREKLMLTETGWPTDGSIVGNHGSLAGAQHYYNEYKSWSSIIPGDKKYYFQMFDQPHRPEPYEKTYGLLYPGNYKDKFSANFDGPVPPSPAVPEPAPTEAPTTQPPKPTPAPTPTPTATEATKAKDEPEEAGSVAKEAAKEAAKSSNSSSPSSFSASGSLDLDGSSDSGSVAFGSVQEDTAIEPDVTKGAEPKLERGDGKEDDEASQPAFGADQPSSDEAVQANTQSSAGGSGTAIGLVAAAGACAVLVGAGFIYQARKKARMLYEEDKNADVTTVVTPCGSHSL